MLLQFSLAVLLAIIGGAQTTTLDYEAPEKVGIAPIEEEIPGLSADESYEVTGGEAWLTGRHLAETKRIRITLDTAALGTGDHSDELQVRHPDGTTIHTVSVNLNISPPALQQFVADPSRAVVYAVHDSRFRGDSIIAIDSESLRPIQAVFGGVGASDLTVDPEHRRLIWVARGDRRVGTLDLEDFPARNAHDIPSFDPQHSTESRIAALARDVFCHIDFRSSGPMQVFDTTSGELIQSLDPGDFYHFTGDNPYFNAILKDPGAPVLYARVGVDFGSQSRSRIIAFEISPDGLLSPVVQTPDEDFPVFGPAAGSSYSQRLFLTPDRKRLYSFGSWFDTTTLTRVEGYGDMPVYNLSPTGTYGAEYWAVFQLADGDELFEAPHRLERSTFTSDYEALIANGISRTDQTDPWSILRRYDLRTILGDPLPGMESRPPDGQPTASAPTLRWEPRSGVFQWEVHLADSAAALVSPSDATRVGTTHAPMFGVSENLQPGETYYWTVRPLPSGPFGPTHSFIVNSITPGSQVIEITTAMRTLTASGKLGVDAPPATSWTATTTTPWIQLDPTSLTGSHELEIEALTEDLAVGKHEGSVTLTSPEGEVEVPVIVTIADSKIYELIPDPLRPSALALSNGGFISRIDTDSLSILRSRKLSAAIGAAAVRRSDGHFFIVDETNKKVAHLDPDTLEEIRSFPFESEANSISPVGPDMVAIDHRGGLDLRRLATGEILHSVPSQVGSSSRSRGWWLSSTNRYVRGGVQGIQLYDITDQGFQLIRSVSTSSNFSERFELSHDERYILDGSRKFDVDLNFICVFSPDETFIVYGLTADGRYAFSQNRLYFGDSGTEAGPFARLGNPVSDFSGTRLIGSDDGRLVAREIVPIPVHRDVHPRDGQIFGEPPDTLSWLPRDEATSYRVYFGSNRDDVASAGPASPLVMGETSGTSIPIGASLKRGHNYYWRIDAITGASATTGQILGFSIDYRFIPIGPNDGLVAKRAIFDDPGILIDSGTVFKVDDLLTMSSTTGTRVRSYPGFGATPLLRTAFMHDRAILGNPAQNVGSNGGRSEGEIAVLRENGGAWTAEWARGPVGPFEVASFSNSVGINHNSVWTSQQMDKTNGPNPGSVHVFGPGGGPPQTLVASTSTVGDRFGSEIQVVGNTALVEADGRGPTLVRDSSIHVFERSPATGLWSETQLLVSPEMISEDLGTGQFSFDGSRIAMFLSSRGRDSIEIFEKNRSGWTVTDTLRPSSGSGISFSGAISIQGDWLCIGGSYWPGGTSNPIAAVFVYQRGPDGWTMRNRISLPSTFGSRLPSNLVGTKAVDGGMVVVSPEGYTDDFPQYHLVILDEEANRRPRLVEPPPDTLHVAAGSPLSMPLEFTDPDSDEVSVVTVSKPSWLTLTKEGSDRFLLEGAPPAAAGPAEPLEFFLNDGNGGSRWYFSDIEVLPADGAPVISPLPGSVTTGKGHVLEIDAEVRGAEPLEFQWEINGQPLPGQFEEDLRIEGWPAPGNYRLVARNAVGETASGEVAVIVDEPGREAGDWYALGGAFNRSYYMPARLGRHTFIEKWESPPEVSVASSGGGLATGGGALVAQTNISQSSAGVQFFDIKDGGLLGTATAPPPDLSPPTFHRGLAWFQPPYQKQTGQSVEPAVYQAFDPATGNVAEEFRTTSYNGRQTTSLMFYRDAALLNRRERPGAIWTGPSPDSGLAVDPIDYCTLHEHTLYSSVEGRFSAYRASSGRFLWTVDCPADSGRASIRGDHAVVAGLESLTCINIKTREIAWSISFSVGSPGPPALDESRVYLPKGNSVLSYHLEDGTPATSYTAGGNEDLSTVIVLDDVLIGFNSHRTHVFEKATGQLLQTLGAGRQLVYSDGFLSGLDSGIKTFFANLAPEFTDGFPDSVIDPGDASDLMLGLSEFTEDLDSDDTFIWSIVSVSRPEIFRTLEIDEPNGDLEVIYNPWESGVSKVVVSVADSAGNVTETTISFSVPPHPLPDPQLAESLVLNPQTGLYEHTITVLNTAKREIAGFDLAITGLPAGVEVYNASACEDDIWCVEHRQPLAAGAAVTLILEYHAPVRGTVIEPEAAVGLVTEPEPDPAAAEPGFAIDRCELLEDGLLIEFTATSGGLYEVQYSEDKVAWKVSPARIRAAGNRVQWIDRGPPRTDSPPTDKASRFYRVRELPDSE